MELSNEPGAVTLSLGAHDFDVAKKFYSELFDFVVDIDAWIGEGAIDRPFRRLRMLFEPNSQLAIEFFAAKGITVQTAVPSPTLTLVVADFDEVMNRFRNRAKDAIVDDATLPYGKYLTITDPSGNRLQIFST